MCWITLHKERAIPKIADKDIKTFKVSLRKDNGTVVPYYFNDIETYAECDKKTQDPLKICFTGKYWTIETGYHSYSKELWYATRGIVCIFAHCKTGCGKMMSYYPDTPKDKLVLIECTIPEGCTYYENEFGEIVSDTIRIDKIISLEEMTESVYKSEYDVNL